MSTSTCTYPLIAEVCWSVILVTRACDRYHTAIDPVTPRCQRLDAPGAVTALPDGRGSARSTVAVIPGALCTRPRRFWVALMDLSISRRGLPTHSGFPSEENSHGRLVGKVILLDALYLAPQTGESAEISNVQPGHKLLPASVVFTASRSRRRLHRARSPCL